ncbi:heavy-metal-associated domain-containing protein [Arthrobacter pigmenti]
MQGMTCGHCVSSVTEELEEVDGVTNVSVDLVPSGTSTVTVDADSSLDSTLLSAAIADAGYEVVAS